MDKAFESKLGKQEKFHSKTSPNLECSLSLLFYLYCTHPTNRNVTTTLPLLNIYLEGDLF